MLCLTCVFMLIGQIKVRWLLALKRCILEVSIANSELRRLFNEPPAQPAAQPSDNHYLGWCKSIISCLHWQSRQPSPSCLLTMEKNVSLGLPISLSLTLGGEWHEQAEKGGNNGEKTEDKGLSNGWKQWFTDPWEKLQENLSPSLHKICPDVPSARTPT